MPSHPASKFSVVGGGLAGALISVYLARAGHSVDVHELRPDIRTGNVGGGRSINLALSHRGIEALRRVDLADEVLKSAVAMPGRMIHSPTGALTFQPYGKDETQVINSVSRGGLNGILLTAAERHPQVKLFFQHKCVDADLDAGTAELVDAQGKHVKSSGDVIIASDGAFSAIRARLQRREGFNFSQDYLEHGYKELCIPAGPNGTFRMEKNALHIWPRSSFMMIALPNIDGSYTCTLFYPLHGRNGFEALKTEVDVRRFFEQTFPDAVPLMPTLIEDFFHNPTGSLVTMRCTPWHVGDRFVMVGDAAHAVVPFYGQGMNAAFEDVSALSDQLAKHAPNWKRAFESYERMRKPNVDALANLAISNFIEMRDLTGQRWFLWKKKAEKWLHKLFPKWYIPLYTMVSFTSTPYAEAVERARKQNERVVTVISLMLLIMLILIFSIV